MIKVYDKNSKEKLIIWRPGQGPEEFQYLRYQGIHDNGTVTGVGRNNYSIINKYNEFKIIYDCFKKPCNFIET